MVSNRDRRLAWGAFRSTYLTKAFCNSVSWDGVNYCAIRFCRLTSRVCWVSYLLLLPISLALECFSDWRNSPISPGEVFHIPNLGGDAGSFVHRFAAADSPRSWTSAASWCSKWSIWLRSTFSLGSLQSCFTFLNCIFHTKTNTFF